MVTPKTDRERKSFLYFLRTPSKTFVFAEQPEKRCKDDSKKVTHKYLCE